MKERPIIFSTPMVQAIREDRKTQTRRLRGLEELNQSLDKEWKVGIVQAGLHSWWSASCDWTWSYRLDCPYGQPGDRLWVKETWKPDHTFEDGGIPRLGIKWGEGVTWKAGNPDQSDPWKPSIHMPRWASRINLEITDIRAERLQDIDDDEAEAEGFVYYGETLDEPTPREKFIQYWDSLNAKRGYRWEANPFVWCISFKKLD